MAVPYFGVLIIFGSYYLGDLGYYIRVPHFSETPGIFISYHIIYNEETLIFRDATAGPKPGERIRSYSSSILGN